MRAGCSTKETYRAAPANRPEQRMARDSERARRKGIESLILSTA
jgi:hypothetical protein